MPEFDRFSGDYQKILDDSVAFSGDGSAYFAEYKARYVAKLLGQGFCGKVLDFGCGVGMLSRYLAEHLPSATLHGFDVSAESIAAVPASLRARGRFVADRAELDRDYDAIIVSNVLHHIPVVERAATVADLGARLSDVGAALVFEHNPLNPLTRYVVDRCAFDDDAILLWPSEALAYFRAAGLTQMKRRYVLFFPRPLRWLRPLERGLGRVPLGAQYVVIARKSR